MIGRKIGPYEVVARVGEGGMGQVYRATDTRLKRQVAIKILPPSLAADPDRLARFQREAEVLASLNHPHIAGIYGLEESGGMTALVMELVEGEDLSQRIARGAIPLDEALPIAKQIADALEAAHEQNIIHRDLKPANIKVRSDGTVKVLDFGLAKAMDVGAGGAGRPGGAGRENLSKSPTITTPAMTQAGMVLGTAAYMSPEQARGKAVDKRADIWAFGVVLYEMLTGRRTFEGEEVTDVLAAVLTREPDLTALPRATPAAVRRVLERCLDKDAKRRLRDIGDARFELFATEPGAAGVSGGPAVRTSRWLLGSLAVIAIGFAALAGWLLLRRSESPSPPTHLSIALPEGHSIVSGPAISRDGRRVAFVSSDGVGRPQLYVRGLDEADSRPLPGTEEANNPFFSPDGQWIAFYARNQLFKVRVDGGAPVSLAASSSNNGGTWADNGTIIFKKTWSGGLDVVSENGGESKSFLTLDAADEYAYNWPYAIPGGREVLFADWGKTFNIFLLDTRTMTKRRVVPWWRRFAYTPSGYLVGAENDGELRAAKLPGVGEAPGKVATVVKGADTGFGGGDARFDLSQNGTLVYVRKARGRRSIVLVDRHGQATPFSIPEGEFDLARLSPDGHRAAVQADFQVYIVDLERGTTTPLELESGARAGPVWSADGRSVTFASNREGNWDIYSKPATGAGSIVPVLKRPLDQNPLSYAADGTLLFDNVDAKNGTELWMLPPNGKTSVWLSNGSVNGEGRFSPEGSLVAYSSNSSGRFEIYVQARDNPADRVQVSVAGGSSPVWSSSGDRLYFRQGNAIMEATLIRAGGLSATAPVRLFDGGWSLAQWYPFDVTSDGQHFVMVQQPREVIQTRIDVVLNWFTVLKQAVADNR